MRTSTDVSKSSKNGSKLIELTFIYKNFSYGCQTKIKCEFHSEYLFAVSSKMSRITDEGWKCLKSNSLINSNDNIFIQLVFIIFDSQN